MLRFAILLPTHGLALALGFASGVYFLPILTAPKSLDAAVLEQSALGALFTADFTRDLAGSDFLHWGEGTVSITDTQIVHQGKLAPGPDYMMYLVPEFVEDEDGFWEVKDAAQRIGPVKTFDGVMLGIPKGVDVTRFNTVLIWCEAFGEFITAARYR